MRDFRDPSSPAWGAWVHQTDDLDEHEAALKRLTEHHIARAAIEALPARNDERALKLVEALEKAVAANSAARAMVPDEEEGLAAQIFAYHINAADMEMRQALADVQPSGETR